MRIPKNHRLCLAAWLAMSAFSCSHLSAATIVESGQARVFPWSGYWWPMRQGGLAAPLGSYDQITGHASVAWERHKRPSGANVPRWFGFCHAWAASSVMEKEPTQPQTATSASGQPVQVRVGDQKGWLAACHTQDVVNSYGQRFTGTETSEDYQDLCPDVLWRLLKLYIKEQGIPLILDIEAGPEVWNYPVYAYELRYEDKDNTGQCLGHLTLLMADDAVPPEYIGVKARRHTYQFTFKLENGSVVMGSAQWVGASRKDHPDFAWYPQLAVAENPEVKHDQVLKLVSSSSASPPRPSTPSQPSPATEQPEPPAPTQPARPPRPEVADRPHPAAPSPTLRSASDALLISPLELVALIADKTSSFGFDVTVDRFDGARYKVGETFSVRGSSEKAGYLYLLHIDSQGHLSLLYPLPGQDNRIAAQRPIEIPGPQDRFAFRLTSPVGINRVKALVTSRPLALTGLLPLSETPQSVAEQPKGRPSRQPGQQTVRQGFRWHPTERKLIQGMLLGYQEKGVLALDQVDQFDAKTIMGPFAQDEVIFYVEARSAGNAPQKPDAPDQKPVQK